jgi:hypothetical protein
MPAADSGIAPAPAGASLADRTPPKKPHGDGAPRDGAGDTQDGDEGAPNDVESDLESLYNDILDNAALDDGDEADERE